jgi:TetR/AcrR family transcriptional repressor of nem operon
MVHSVNRIVSMAAAKTAKGRATRARILQAATDLVSQRGVAGTSLDDVRERAGASKSQLYLYFANREELLCEVANQTCDTVVDRHMSVLSGFDSVAGLKRYLNVLIDRQTQREMLSGCPIATLAGQLANQNEPARRVLADGFERWQDGLRAGFETLASQDKLNDDASPVLLATQALALIQGGLLLTQVQHDIEPLRAAADAVLSLVHTASR